MQKKSHYHVAVVGATGAVGEQIIQLLEERPIPLEKLTLLASGRSAGKKVRFRGAELTIEEASPEKFTGVDIALFSAGGSISKRLAPEAVQRGAVVIDNTSAYRMDPEVPLVVPEVNPEDIGQHQGIIANPNCSTIQMVVALKPLYDAYGFQRLVVSTYQAVSGAGAKAIAETMEQTAAVLEDKPVKKEILPVSSLPVHHQIAFNAIPQIDVFHDNGFTNEEMKMVNETQKIMHDETIQTTVTCVRIPVTRGHSESIYVELHQDYELADVRRLLQNSPGIIVEDEPDKQIYPMAINSEGRNEVFVGRLRRDLFNPRGLNMWVVSDNLLKGAAWNAVQIAEHLIK
jgi:aspartate-semialdehyde dehydrogenase